MLLFQESTDDNTSTQPAPEPENIPRIIDRDPSIIDQITNKDRTWQYDQNGKPYYNYTDRNGVPYEPWYVMGKNFWNYYITYFSTFIHIMVMMYGMDYWCRWSKIMMFYSF